MLTLGSCWALWRPDADTAVHVDWTHNELDVHVERRGKTTTIQKIPLPAPVKTGLVTVAERSVVVTARTQDNRELELYVYCYPELGGAVELRMEGLGFLLDVALKEG